MSIKEKIKHGNFQTKYKIIKNENKNQGNQKKVNNFNF